MKHHRIFLLALSLWLPACGGTTDSATTPNAREVVADGSSSAPPTEAVGTPSQAEADQIVEAMKQRGIPGFTALAEAMAP